MINKGLLRLAAIIVIVTCPGCPNVLVGAMTDRDRKDLLWSHNIYRQKLAYAEYPNQKQGANLNELQYSKILEDAAQNYINTECSQKVKGGTVTINGVTGEYGQLIYTYDGRIETNLDQTWTAYDCAKTEKYYVNQNIQHYVDNPEYSRFTQLMWAKTQYVGCGIVKYKHDSIVYKFIAICNYFPAGNIPGQEVYKQGMQCSQCTTCSTVFKGLCKAPDRTSDQIVSVFFEYSSAAPILKPTTRKDITGYDQTMQSTWKNKYFIYSPLIYIHIFTILLLVFIVLI